MAFSPGVDECAALDSSWILPRRPAARCGAPLRLGDWDDAWSELASGLRLAHDRPREVEAAFANMAVSDDPFDRSFRDHVRDVHGVDVEDGVPPPEQIMDHRSWFTAAHAEFCCS